MGIEQSLQVYRHYSENLYFTLKMTDVSLVTVPRWYLIKAYMQFELNA